MIDGVSQMVCIYIVFRILERVYSVWNDPDLELKFVFTLAAVIAIVMVVGLAMRVHQVALTTGSIPLVGTTIK
jgi:hypothetical protein